MLLITSHVEICSIICMRGLSIDEIERICHHAQFFIMSYGRFQHLTNFLNKLKKNTFAPKYQVEIVVIFSQLLSFNFNYFS